MESVSNINSTVESTGALARKLLVSVPATRVGAELDKAFKSLAGRAKLKGFRKGKVPRAVLEREYGDEVRRDVVNGLIDSACGEAIESNRLDVVIQPRLLRHDLRQDGGLEFEAEVEVRPQFELGPYKSVEIERKILRVDDSHVAAAIDGLRERMAVLETEADRVNVEPGDVVLFDMYGFHEGEAVSGASGEGIQLEVGEGRFPEDFEKQLVGVTRAIKTPIVVKFEDNHHEESVAGKTIRFDVTVREIKRKIVPELSDEFVKDLGWDGCDSLEDLRKRVREDLEHRADHDADGRVRSEMIDKLVDANQFEVPPTLIDQTISRLAYGMGLREVPQDKVEELRTALRPRAVRQVRAGFVMDSIASEEKLEVSKEELEQALREQVIKAGDRAEEVRKYYSEPSALVELHTSLLREKALERVVELSTQRDVKVDESQVADKV